MRTVGLLLVLLVLAFAWSIGAHYTGACMGIAYGSKSIRLFPALVVMASLAWVGAAVASHRVEVTVGLHIIDAAKVTVEEAIAILMPAFALTTAYTAWKIPTSTIQILVFCVVGTALAAKIPVHCLTIVRLSVIWVLAPPIALALGYLFTHALDCLVRYRPQTADGPTPAIGVLSRLLVVVGAAASFTMGANAKSTDWQVWDFNFGLVQPGRSDVQRNWNEVIRANG